MVGKSGCGKSTLPVLFSEYLSKKIKKEEIIINATNSLGKAPSNKEWHLKRDVISEVLPIMPFEGKECEFTVNDSFTSKGKFKLDPRFRFSDKHLINYLLKLQDENPNQDLNLKIKVGKKATGSSYLHIYDLKYELELFKNQNGGDSSDSQIHDVLVNADENNEIKYFIIVENINKECEKEFLELLNIVRNSNYSKDNIFVIGTVNVNELNCDLSLLLLDNVNVIELEKCSIGDYISADFDKYVKFKDLIYIESIIYDDISGFSIFEMRKMFDEVYFNEFNILDLISKELSAINEIFLKNGMELGLRTINDILRFLLVSWKYEGEPSNWINWEKYFDIQFKQKILPKIKNKPIYEEFINDLLKVCGKYDVADVNIKEDIKYRNTYLKLKNMEKSVDIFKFSFFNCYNNFDVKSIENEVSIVEIKNNKSKNKENKSKYGSNIYKYRGFFVINKQINRKNINFGRFDSLSEATFVKNILVKNDWKLSRIRNNDCIYLNESKYWIIKVFGEKLVILGKFKSYNDANEHVEWLVHEFKNNNDFKVYVAEEKTMGRDRNKEIIESLNGWQKLVFNAIEGLKKRVFSLDDLKALDLFEMYQFEDESLEEIIAENLMNLVNLTLIEFLGNNYYRKV